MCWVFGAEQKCHDVKFLRLNVHLVSFAINSSPHENKLNAWKSSHIVSGFLAFSLCEREKKNGYFFFQNKCILYVFEYQALNHYSNLHFCLVNKKLWLRECFCLFGAWLAFYSNFGVPIAVLGFQMTNQNMLWKCSLKKFLGNVGQCQSRVEPSSHQPPLPHPLHAHWRQESLGACASHPKRCTQQRAFPIPYPLPICLWTSIITGIWKQEGGTPCRWGISLMTNTWKQEWHRLSVHIIQTLLKPPGLSFQTG